MKLANVPIMIWHFTQDTTKQQADKVTKSMIRKSPTGLTIPIVFFTSEYSKSQALLLVNLLLWDNLPNASLSFSFARKYGSVHQEEVLNLEKNCLFLGMLKKIPQPN